VRIARSLNQCHEGCDAVTEPDLVGVVDQGVPLQPEHLALPRVYKATSDWGCLRVMVASSPAGLRLPVGAGVRFIKLHCYIPDDFPSFLLWPGAPVLLYEPAIGTEKKTCAALYTELSMSWLLNLLCFVFDYVEIDAAFSSFQVACLDSARS